MMILQGVALSLVVVALPSTSPAQAPPRDRIVAPSAAPQTPAAREVELRAQIAGSTAAPLEAYFELSKLQEARGAIADAEATLLRARDGYPSTRRVFDVLAGFYNRQGQFEKTIEALEASAKLDPSNPAPYQLITTYYWDKVSKDKQLTPPQKWTYIFEGIGATDRALAINPDYTEALTYKNILLRMRGGMETDPAQQQKTLAEADALRNRALELTKQRTGVTVERTLISGSGQTVVAGTTLPPGSAPVRVGGSVRPPTKLKHVSPVYPPEAEAARITGIVILETTIATDGRVLDARVLKSVQGLDQAAVDAVRQWEFTPTMLNGVPVPVIMTVTVNFTLQ